MARWGTVVLLFVGALQVVPTWARPDFGISGAIQDSAAVRLAALSLGQTFDRLDEVLDFDLTDPPADQAQLFAAVRTIGSLLAPLGSSAASALASATTSTSELEETFRSVMDPLVDLQTTTLVQVAEVLLELTDLVGPPLVLQLVEEVDMIYVSTRNLIGALIQLLASVRNAEESGDVSGATVDRVRRAVLDLRSHIERLTYTLGSTSSGIGTANAFLTRLAASVAAAEAEDREALDRFQSKLDRFENSVTYLTDCLASDYVTLRADVSTALGALEAASGECVLQYAAESLVDSLTTGWERVVCVVKRHYTLLGRNCDVTEDLSASYMAVYELGTALAQLTAGNGLNGLYCFNKFSLLVENLILQLTDDAAVCLKQESTRLRSLQESLQHMFPTVVYDVEELLLHLELCGTVLEQHDRCVSELGELYEHLAAHTHRKLELIEGFSLAETSASADRLKLCVLHSRYTVLHLELARLRNELEDCRFTPSC